MKRSGKNQQLLTEVNNGVLSISIGVDVLAWALEHQPCLGYNLTILDNEKFAKEVMDELASEQEDGTTEVHIMLDKACDDAIGNGAQYADIKDID